MDISLLELFMCTGNRHISTVNFGPLCQPESIGGSATTVHISPFWFHKHSCYFVVQRKCQSLSGVLALIHERLVNTLVNSFLGGIVNVLVLSLNISKFCHLTLWSFKELV